MIKKDGKACLVNHLVSLYYTVYLEGARLCERASIFFFL